MSGKRYGNSQPGGQKLGSESQRGHGGELIVGMAMGCLANGSHSQHQLVHIWGFLLSKGNLFEISVFKLRKAMALGKMA